MVSLSTWPGLPQLPSLCHVSPRITYSTLQTLVDADWSWPQSQQNKKLKDLFSSGRERASEGKFKAAASELLQAFPLIRYFAEHVVQPTGELNNEVASLLAVCSVVDLVLAAKRQQCRAEQLQLALKTHLESHILAYGEEHLVPKHHFSLHHPSQLVRDGVLLDCFVHERKHQVLKHCGGQVKNTRVFERSVTGRVLLEQRRQLRGLLIEDALVGHQCSAPDVAKQLGVDSATVGKCIQYRGVHFSVGDVVLFGGACGGIVNGCAESIGSLYLIVDQLQLVEQCTASSSKWQIGGLCAARLTGSTGTSLAYCWSIDRACRTVLVLHPEGAP